MNRNVAGRGSFLDSEARILEHSDRGRSDPPVWKQLAQPLQQCRDVTVDRDPGADPPYPFGRMSVFRIVPKRLDGGQAAAHDDGSAW